MIAFLFVDGLGLNDAANSPLHTLDLSTFKGLTRGWSFDAFSGAGLAYQVLDATLGVDGLPQSGTGQTSLLTGQNAAGLLGYPQGPHPGKKLQALLEKESLQVKVKEGGLEGLHANGYRAEYLERAHGSRRDLLSAFAFASKSAGLELFPLDHPKAIAPAFWPDPQAAGKKFAQFASLHQLTILEAWALDLAAHRQPENLP